MSAGTPDAQPGSLTPEQCRGARGLLDMTRNQLAAAARVSLATLYQFENGERVIKPKTQALIRSALEAAGADFIPENGGGAGVRLRKGDASPSAAAPGGRLRALR